MSDASISLHAVPRLSKPYRFQWEQAQQAWVLLYPEGMITLNGSAGAVLRRVDAQRSVGDVISALQIEFPGADRAPDILDFLEQARTRGWITIDG